MALISIAIYDTPENGRDKYTAETLACLANTVDPSRHRFIFSINAATETSMTAIRKLSRTHPVQVLEMPENIGTARAINQAWKYRGPGEHAVKMDNDVFIHFDGWADWLELAVAQDETIGIAGLKRKDCIQNPDHPDPFYRSVLRFALSPHIPGERFCLVEETADIMGTCTLFSSALLDTIGYLYQPGLYGFDDVLACLRSRAAGFCNVFLPWIEIDHLDHGGGEYTKWKQREAMASSAEYHRLKAGYENGTISPFYPVEY